jgi:chromate reductase, NAD(P)H dehydrogenase (quinone)
VTTYTVGYLVGSLASDSINRTLSKALIRLAPPRLELTEIPIGELPLYSRATTRSIRPPAGS